MCGLVRKFFIAPKFILAVSVKAHEDVMDDGSSWEHPLQRAVELASSAESCLLLAVSVKRMSNQRPIEWTFCSCQSADRNRRRWGWLSEVTRHLLAQWDQHDSPPAALSRDVTHCSEKLVSKETIPPPHGGPLTGSSSLYERGLMWSLTPLLNDFHTWLSTSPQNAFFSFLFFSSWRLFIDAHLLGTKNLSAQNEQLISVLCCPPHWESTFRMTCSWPEGRIELQNWKRDVLL